MSDLVERTEDWIPQGYIHDDPNYHYTCNENTLNFLAETKSIYKRDRRIPVGESDFKKTGKADEYQQLQHDLWTYWDTQPVKTIESAIIETEGALLGGKKDGGIANNQRVKEDLEDYLKVRLETGEAETISS